MPIRTNRRRKRPRVLTNCVADAYTTGEEKIVEFSNGKNTQDTHLGGLISFKNLPDGTLRVEVYRCDKGVTVRAGGQDVPAHYEEK